MFLLPFSSYSQKVIFVSQIYLVQNHEVGPPNEEKGKQLWYGYHTIIVCLSPRSEFICSNRKADFVIKVIYSTKHNFFISKHHMEIKYKISTGWINDNILQRWGIKSAKNPQVMRMTPPEDSLEMLLRK